MLSEHSQIIQKTRKEEKVLLQERSLEPKKDVVRRSKTVRGPLPCLAWCHPAIVKTDLCIRLQGK
jgi:hypothetical protein